MLGLKLTTDTRWVKLVETNLEAMLSDHAWCEKKAASNALALITYNFDKDDLVDEMTAIAQEEMQHFEQVLAIIRKKGFKLLIEEKDNYVNQLYQFMGRGGSREYALVERLLFAAMVEARSCERFKTISEHIQDSELSSFYYELMISEANHYTTFLKFAKQYGPSIDVDKRWKEWLDFEDSIIKSFGSHQSVHG
ncbi:MAG: tRNA-(ms[2]io[6]A)-hydroxylase [Flavobacteriales bacterium]|jgi:tRNA-(ms[2]io[6]A)-hydroxylase